MGNILPSVGHRSSLTLLSFDFTTLPKVKPILALPALQEHVWLCGLWFLSPWSDLLPGTGKFKTVTAEHDPNVHPVWGFSLNTHEAGPAVITFTGVSGSCHQPHRHLLRSPSLKFQHYG